MTLKIGSLNGELGLELRSSSSLVENSRVVQMAELSSLVGGSFYSWPDRGPMSSF